MNYKWSFLKDFIEPTTMLDIGAHVGDHYTSFHDSFPDCKCLLIDGNPSVEPHLKQKNVPYYIKLLGKETKEATFYINRKNSICTGSSMFKEMSEHYKDCIEQKLMCYRLDDLNKKNTIFDYVKIDVQGAELDVLEGGWNTFSKTSAFMLETSLDKHNENAPLQYEIIKFMTDRGFVLKAVMSEAYNSEGKVFLQDLLFVKNKPR